MNKKEKILPKILEEIMEKNVKLINFFSEAYIQGSEYILHLFLNVGIIYFLIKIMNHFESGGISQIILSIVLVIHLIMWLCWMINNLFCDVNEKEVFLKC